MQNQDKKQLFTHLRCWLNHCTVSESTSLRSNVMTVLQYITVVVMVMMMSSITCSLWCHQALSRVTPSGLQSAAPRWSSAVPCTMEASTHSTHSHIQTHTVNNTQSHSHTHTDKQTNKQTHTLDSWVIRWIINRCPRVRLHFLWHAVSPLGVCMSVCDGG